MRTGFPVNDSQLLMIAGFVLIFLSALSVPAQPNELHTCKYPNLVEWPSGKPIWKLCWVRPEQSSGISASGLELRSVYYKNRLVMSRGNIPVLNVKYKIGGCGGPYNTYRDWLGHLQAFEADNPLLPGYAEPKHTPITVCENPGRDAGEFAGVAVEKLSDRLILTSQFRSAWYRYIIKWTFYLDGTIEPRIGFSAVDYFCTRTPHTHHAFWRFDTDIDGAQNDLVEELNLEKYSSLEETHALRDDVNKRSWQVKDSVTKTVLQILPGVADNTADSFAVADFWSLGYNPNEIDDGGAVRGPTGDQPHMDKFINGEPIAKGKGNVVVWYRSGTNHAGDANQCDTVGPTLRLKTIAR